MYMIIYKISEYGQRPSYESKSSFRPPAGIVVMMLIVVGAQNYYYNNTCGRRQELDLLIIARSSDNLIAIISEKCD